MIRASGPGGVATRCILAGLEGTNGTFVNGFCVFGKFLVNYDRIRVGRTTFVFLDQDEFDPGVLQLAQLERDWDWSLEHAAGSQAPTTIAPATFVQTTTAINSMRDPDEIQARVFEWIFRVIPVERVAIRLVGHGQDCFSSSTYCRAGSANGDPFAIDDAMTLKVLREDKTAWNEKVICSPMTVLDMKVGVINAVMAAEGFENVLGAHICLLEAIAASTAVTLRHLQEVTWLEGENRRLNEVINVEHGMVGQSARMKEVYSFIARIGPTERPVDIATLKTLRTGYAAALTNSLDGGKRAMIERNKQREAVIHAMQQIAKYVELNCRNDEGIFLSSGLKPASFNRAPQPLAQPTVLKVGHGITGQLLIRVRSVGASSYELRWGVSVNGAPPTSWTTTGFTNTKSVIAVTNLTPGTTYAFQVRALGPLGYNEYSDSVTRMAN